MEPLDDVIKYALQFVGIPYIYGGNSPHVGLDCSGLVCEVLKAYCVLHTKEDLSAQQLYQRLLRDAPSTSPTFSKGQILFFGSSTANISHCAIAVSEKRVVEAGGGGTNITTPQLADAVGAYVKVRMARSDLRAAIMPRYVF